MTARAPDVAIATIAQGNASDSVQLALSLTGGAYDRIEYEWEDGSGRGNTVGFSDPTIRNPVWTRPHPGRDQWYTVRCNITVHGTGGNADSGTSDTTFAEERAFVFHVPDADAPSVRVDAIPNDFEGRRYNMVLSLGDTHAGTYDSLTYRWQVFGYRSNNWSTDITGSSMSDATSREPTWTRPRETSDQEVFVRCTVTAHGSSHFARRGTSESTYHQVRTTVRHFPAAAAPTLLHVQYNDVDDSPDAEHHWANTGGTGEEADTVWIRLTHSKDGHYDTIRYDWAWKWHDEGADSYRAITGEQVTGEQPDWIWNRLQWTRPRTAARRQYDLRCVVTVTGTDGNAERNTTDTATLFGAEDATYIDPLPAARAPTIEHIRHEVGDERGNGVPNGLEGSSVKLFASFAAGREYDRIAYQWQLFDENGDEVSGAFSHPTLLITTLTRPQISGAARKTYRVRLTVNVEGRDERYNAGSTNSTHHDANAVILNHPAAEAPSLLHFSVPAGRAGTTVRAGVHLGQATRPDQPTPGRYDRVTFLWAVHRGAGLQTPNIADSALDDKTLQNPLFTRPDVGASNDSFGLYCTCTAHGDGINADEGTTDTSSTVEVAVVTPAPVARLDSVSIDSIIEGYEGTIATAEAVVSGLFDAAEYTWSYSDVGGANPVAIEGTGKTVTFTRPDTDADAEFQINVSVTVQGGLPSSRPGSSAGPMTATGLFSVLNGFSSTNIQVTDENGVLRHVSHLAWADGMGTRQDINGAWYSEDGSAVIELFNEAP